MSVVGENLLTKNVLERMKELITVLEPAARAYYTSGVETMSNFEYDKLYDELDSLEKQSGVILAGSPTQKVGYEVASSLPKEKHSTPMLSLAKTKSVADLVEKADGRLCFLSWKMDGLTVVLTYENGELVKAVTRGNGKIGEVITQNAKYMKGVPLKITEKNRKVIRGEATIPYSVFKKINNELPADVDPYKNPRNLCSGTIRNLDPQIVASRNVTFSAFDYVEGSDTNSHSEGLKHLQQMGFGVVEGKLVKPDEIEDAVKWFEEKIKTFDQPSDGLVLVYDDIAYGESLGTTSKFPRKGLAFKWMDEEAETTITEIDWSVSRTSLINPVAVFNSVELEGTTVSRASIHNLSIMESLKIGIGDKVKVIKANMIIPQITQNLTKSGNIEIPKTCPICGAPTKIKVDPETGTKTLHCTGDNCVSILSSKIDHFCSRDAMNIVGISEKTIDAFLREGLLTTPVDIYSLEKYEETIVQMEGFGKKSFDKMIEAINASKHVEAYKFLYAIGIPNFGLSNCENVCKTFDFESAYDFAAVTKEELTAIDGIGDVMAESFVNFFSNKENMSLVVDLMKHISFVVSEKVTTNLLEGKTFVITGTLEKSSRKELQSLIETNGGKVAGSVSSKTEALINNDATSNSSKNKTAKSLGIKIITEEEFYSQYNL